MRSHGLAHPTSASTGAFPPRMVPAMRMTFLAPFSAALLGLALSACGGDESSGAGTFRADIDGRRFVGSINVVAQRMNDIAGVSGVDRDHETLALAFPAMVGAHTIAAGVGTNAALSRPSTGEVWQAVGAVGAGTIQVSRIDEAGMEGTFELSLPANAMSPAMGTKMVSNGEFSVQF